MIRELIVIAVCASCGASAPQPAPVIGNRSGVADSRPGAIAGVVTDAKSGEPLAGVTVTIARPQGEPPDNSAVISDDKGQWRSRELLAGNYTITMYYADVTIEIDDVIVQPAATSRADYRVDQTNGAGEVVRVQWH